MHKSNEDCFYFLTSSCAKGASCTYRHSPLALTCNVICSSWSRGSCLDPACPYRHTAAQRPMMGNGILCFYESTPMGCLKPDCTFIHSRPRTHVRNTTTIRPPSATLVNKDGTKPNTPPVDTLQTAPVSRSEASLPQPSNNETPAKTVPSVNAQPSPPVKSEVVTRRIATPSINEQTTETNHSSDSNNHTVKKSASRSVITDSTKDDHGEIPCASSRLVVNRNVVLAEPTNGPHRKIVQTTPSSSPSSNRVVVSSDVVTISSKVKSNDVDVSEQENNTKRFKSDRQSVLNTPSPTPAIMNRLSSISSKEATSANDVKPVRLYRDRLPATQVSNGSSPITVAKPSNEEKTSAGTGLSQNDKRRTMRLERFQKNPISPPRSIVSSSPAATNNNDMTTTTPAIRNVVTSSPNERKRTAPETTPKYAPPPKRLHTSATVNQSLPRSTTSSLNAPAKSSPSSIRHNDVKSQADAFTTKTAPRKNSPSTPSLHLPSTSSSAVRPRFIVQPIVAPLMQQTPSTRTPRPRQPPSVVIKRPLIPVTAPSQTTTKPSEPSASTTLENRPSSSLKTAVERLPSNPASREDENQLLTLDEPTDVVDTFALIDEALLEADHLLELM